MQCRYTGVNQLCQSLSRIRRWSNHYALSFGSFAVPSLTVPSLKMSFGLLFSSATVSFVITHFSISSREGNSNITSNIILSIIERNPRAPVLRSIAFLDRKSTRLNSSHVAISYAVFCLKKKKQHSHIVIARL